MVARLLRLIVLPLAVASPAIVVAVACNNDDTGIACQKDTDCPTGDICRDLVCGLNNPDAASLEGDTPGFDTDDEAGSCSEDGTSCTIANECCSGQCVESVCAATANNCVTANELCQNDCCTGLTCTNGTCQ